MGNARIVEGGVSLDELRDNLGWILQAGGSVITGGTTRASNHGVQICVTGASAGFCDGTACWTRVCSTRARWLGDRT